MPSETPFSHRHSDFAFLGGAWHVHHRELRRRLAGSRDWFEFAGSCRAWELMNGAANIDDNVLFDPGGTYRAVSFRTFDAATGDWSIWWVEARAPALTAPVTGRFSAGRGMFLSAEQFEGRAIMVRFIWSDISLTAARWEQAFSADGGVDWEVNWIMNFERAA
jgi:hypothetical protein